MPAGLHEISLLRLVLVCIRLNVTRSLLTTIRLTPDARLRTRQLRPVRWT